MTLKTTSMTEFQIAFKDKLLPVPFIIVLYPNSICPGLILLKAPCDGRIYSPPLTLFPQRQAAAPILEGVPVEVAVAPAAPVIPEFHPPFIPEALRLQELSRSLNIRFIKRDGWTEFSSLVSMTYKQAIIDRRIQDVLINDGYSALSVLAKRGQLRDLIFYRGDTEPLSEATLNRYLGQISTLGTRDSLPYQKILRAIRNLNIILYRR